MGTRPQISRRMVQASTTPGVKFAQTTLARGLGLVAAGIVSVCNEDGGEMSGGGETSQDFGMQQLSLEHKKTGTIRLRPRGPRGKSGE